MEILLKPARESGCEDIDSLEKVLQDALEEQRSPVEDILDSGVVDEERYLQSLAWLIGMEWLVNIPECDEPKSLQSACGAKVALPHRLLPVDIVGEENDRQLVLATYNPLDLIARQKATHQIELPIVWKMASRQNIHTALRKLYGIGADTFEQILEGRELDYENLEATDKANIIDADEDQEASILKFVNQIIREALQQRATDIHVEPLHNNLRIRYRVDGLLIDVVVPEKIKVLQSSVIARLKIMAHLDIAERRLPQDGRINLQLGGQTIDVRVATVPTVEGESLSLRLLNSEKFTIAKLELEPFVQNKIEKLLKLTNGIVLVTGPTGSGKSTSLYSFLNEVNQPDTRIVTIEDPVENKLSGVMQIAVKSDIGLTFASGLRSILRADPNIIMIGEIRDLETAEISIRASLTGHLVFSTLHTNDALGGITRLIDMGVDPFLVSASVRAFLAQRLVRRLCENCKTPRELTTDERNTLKIPEHISGQCYKAVGCSYCQNTGFSGRFAIFEIILLTKAMQNLIVKGADNQDLSKQSHLDGYVPMREYGWSKVMGGQTTIEEVLSVTSSELV